MTSETPQLVVQRYLNQVARHLQDLPDSERFELIEDLRAHIEEATGGVDAASEADVRNVLDRLGQPQDLAREARERASDTDEPAGEDQPTLATEQRKTPGALEVAAIILTAVFWPIGIVLAWASDRWLTRDKIVATAIPFAATLMLGVIVLGSMVVYGGYSMTSVVVSDVQPMTQPADPPGPSTVEPRSPQQFAEQTDGGFAVSRFVIVLGFLGGILAGPFVAAVYLAIRLQPMAVPAELGTRYNHRRNGVPAGGQL
jgi:uncharacterized membrane protein